MDFAQASFLDMCELHPRLIVKWTRYSGCTTANIRYAAKYAREHDGCSVLFVSVNGVRASGIARGEMPGAQQSHHTFRLTNGSSLWFCFPRELEHVRGIGANLVIVDGADGLSPSAFAVLAPCLVRENTKVIFNVNSTGELFNKMQGALPCVNLTHVYSLALLVARSGVPWEVIHEFKQFLSCK